MKVNFEKYKKYVAYIDVLGYSNLLVTQSMNDQVRIQTLYEIWENLAVALNDVEKNFPAVEKILFSDSIFFASEDIVDLVTSLIDLYIRIIVYYEYESNSDLWMPMLRSGISYNWLININDPTLTAKLKNSQHQFRNPAGPAIAEAYCLSEDSGFKGMRILVPDKVMDAYLTSCKQYNFGSTDFRKLCSDKLSHQEWPIAKRNLKLKLKNGTVFKEFDAFDLPWWWGLDDKYPENFRVFERHKWQIEIGNSQTTKNDVKSKVLEHYTETERLFRYHAIEE